MRLFTDLLALPSRPLYRPIFSAPQNYLANKTILILRHAKKSPKSGTGLTPQGENRAQLYLGIGRKAGRHLEETLRLGSSLSC